MTEKVWQSGQYYVFGAAHTGEIVRQSETGSKRIIGGRILLKGESAMKYAVIIGCVLGCLVFAAGPVLGQGGRDDSAFYAKSWAVVIGINAYPNFPPLEYAVNDATAVATRLRSMGFEVITLLDQEATKAKLLDVLKKQLPASVGREDRLVIFYAGHGAAGILPTGEEMGFIIPIDGKAEFQGQPLEIIGGEVYVNEYESFAEQTNFMSVDDIRDISDMVAAKHILYVIDGCYSGFLDPAVYSRRPSRRMGEDIQVAQGSRTSRSLVLEDENVSDDQADSGPVPSPQQDPLKYLEVITTRDTVQILTAGSSGEAVYEKSGHGLFTYYLLRALDGAADISDNPNSPVGDCVITATELGNYLKEKVPEASNFSQSPLFNRISGEGEFIFVPPICKSIDPADTKPPIGDESWTKTDAYQGSKDLRYKVPQQVVVDQNENIYVLDTGLQRILKFDSQGQFLPEQLAEVTIDPNWAPTSMAIGYGGELWVYYSWQGKTRSKQTPPAGKLVVYNSDGSQSMGWGNSFEPLSACVYENGLEAPFPSSGLVALDIEDNVVIVDLDSGVLTKCDRNGKLLHQWGKKEEHAVIEDISRYKTVTNPQGLAIDMFGYIYVADTDGHGIQKYYDGEWLPSWPNVQGTNDYFFDSPHGLAVDSNLYVYVADTDNNRIKKYTSGGEKLLTLWGREKAKKGKKYGEFNTPMGVAVNWDSTRIYVADTGNKRIQKFVIER